MTKYEARRVRRACRFICDGLGSGTGAGRVGCQHAAVDETTGTLAEQDAVDFFGGFASQLDEPLDAVECGVGRQDDSGMLAKAVVVEGLALDHIEASAEEVAGIERL